MNGATAHTPLAPQPIPQSHRDISAPPLVPASLVIAAGWAWRILILAAGFVALAMLLGKMYLISLPVFFAILLAALLHPLTKLLRRVHLSRLVATAVTVIVALALIGGVGLFVVSQARANSQELITQLQALFDKAQGYAEQLPFANPTDLQTLQKRAISAVEANISALAKDVVTAGSLAAETLTGLIILAFLTFFFLLEGDKIWTWLTRLFPQNVQPSVLGAGFRAWNVLSSWIVGTALIAAFHGIVIGATLALLGVPLAVPLAMLVFLGSFVPVVGVLIFGGLAVLVTLVTQGWIFALIVLGVLVLTGQIEAHVLQPFIVGRAVKLHPVTIALTLTGGAIIGGVFGAIIAIPVVASCHAAVKYLTGVEDLDGVVRRGKKDRMKAQAPPQYAPLPLYSRPPDQDL